MIQEVHFVKSEEMPVEEYRSLLIDLIDTHGVILVATRGVRTETQEFLSQHDCVVVGPIPVEKHYGFLFGRIEAFDTILEESICVLCTTDKDYVTPEDTSKFIEGPTKIDDFHTMIVTN